MTSNQNLGQNSQHGGKKNDTLKKRIERISNESSSRERYE